MHIKKATKTKKIKEKAKFIKLAMGLGLTVPACLHFIIQCMV